MLKAMREKIAFLHSATSSSRLAQAEKAVRKVVDDDRILDFTAKWRDPKQPRAKDSDIKRQYKPNPGFCDFLPWVEYLEDSQCFLLEDNISVGAAFELIAIGTEGREMNWLMEQRELIEKALQDSFAEDDIAPWIVQFFCQDDTDFAPYISRLRKYVKERAEGTTYTEHFLDLTTNHMRAIAKPGGLFKDTRVTKMPWRGQNRRVRMVVYRRVPRATKTGEQTHEQMLNQACERIVGSLQGAGLSVKRLNGHQFYEWLLPWFNPNPTLTDDEPIDFYPKVPFFNSGTEDSPDTELLPLPFSHDFSERLLFNEPISDVEKGYWYFDKMPHKVIVVDKIRQVPKIGHVTGETSRGDARNAVFDQLPEGSALSITMVIKPQDKLEEHLNRLKKKSIGENTDSSRAREDAETAFQIIGRDHKLYRGAIAFYLRGDDEKDLHNKSVALTNALLAADMQPVREGEEIAACDSYIRWLPMCYNPLDDRKEWYTSMMFAQHIANLSPVWGRSIGTGNPGLSFFNRGGAPLTFDMLNKLDRSMNAHMLVFGPTGAGKSATLVTMMCQVMGIYRPRLFIVEAGNSFGLLGQFFSLLGLSVNQISIKPGTKVTLAPFADAKLLVLQKDRIKTPVLDEEGLQKEEEHQKTKALEKMVDKKLEQGSSDSTAVNELFDDDDDKRDVISELEIIARLMITGGETQEENKVSRADRSIIRKAIENAAKKCVSEGRPVLTTDVRLALKEISRDPDFNEDRKGRISEMAEAMDVFCQGFEGEMFDRPGEAWPEADVTLVDLGQFAREGNQAQMSVAYISLMNTVNNIAERDQNSGRPIIMVTDEGHIITKNPLVAPYAVKITKMWRKLGAWFWLATQNMADFPGSAETLLNMIEWWCCLVMPKSEIDEIARFKKLNPEQRSMLLSANKEMQKYTEGVILSKNNEMLFRTVPPSLYLALAMTEPDEKQDRAQIMREHNCSELEAAFHVAERLDQARGIEPMKWRHLFKKNEEVAA
jgi:conjugative transfer ATPase, PFL_4706 family